jgi:protein SCO1/2
MLRVLVVALVLLVAIMVLMPRTARLLSLKSAVLANPPRALPDVALVDQTGQPLRVAALDGRFSLLIVGDTQCGEPCAAALGVLAGARADVAARAREAAPQLVFLSADPERDTPAAIRAYLAAFDPAFLGVTARASDLDTLLAALGAGAGRAAAGPSTTVYFIGPAAELIARADSPYDAKTLAADYLKVRGRYFSTHRAAP